MSSRETLRRPLCLHVGSVCASSLEVSSPLCRPVWERVTYLASASCSRARRAVSSASSFAHRCSSASVWASAAAAAGSAVVGSAAAGSACMCERVCVQRCGLIGRQHRECTTAAPPRSASIHAEALLSAPGGAREAGHLRARGRAASSMAHGSRAPLNRAGLSLGVLHGAHQHQHPVGGKQKSGG